MKRHANSAMLWVVVFGVVVGLTAMGCSGSPEVESDPTADSTDPVPATQPDEDPGSNPVTDRPDADENAWQAKIKDVFFEYDKYELRGEARAVLQENARYLREHPTASVLLEGHCDDRGTNEYNLALAQRRAEAVRDYLGDLGVDTSQLNTISYGEERPFELGQTESAWAKNRRVHFNLAT